MIAPTMRLSVVIPVLNEEDTIGQTLDHVVELKLGEIIVVDGGSCDRTTELVRARSCILTSTLRGRARQMNHGAQMASGDVLLFLHADTRLPNTARRDIEHGLDDLNCIGGRFDVEFATDRWLLRVVGALINFRSRVTRVATGDQALFVRRTVFESLGGFPEIPIMEDIAFSRMLKRSGPVACLESRVITSARRWEGDGAMRTIFLMWTLKSLYLAGVPPRILARLYADRR